MVALCALSRFARLSTHLPFSRLTRRGLATIKPQASLFSPLDTFSERHIGPDDRETSVMLSKLGYSSMDAFIEDTVPPRIRVSPESLDNIPVLSESQLHARAQALGKENKQFKSYIGMGYHSAVVPPVILRNVCS
jgi:glycine dehydrogenase